MNIIQRALAVSILAAIAAPGSLFAQTITLDSVSTPTTCDTAQVTVYYTASGTFGAKNVFTVQLSQDSTFTSFTNTSTIKSTASGSIVLSIPNGDHYRVRIASSSPYLASNNNGSDIQVRVGPVTSFYVNDSVQGYPRSNVRSLEDTLTFKATKWWQNGLTYAWDFGSDATPQTSSDPVVQVTFASSGSKQVSLTVSNGSCSATNTQPAAAVIFGCVVLL
jgi:PKD repeat protein